MEQNGSAGKRILITGGAGFIGAHLARRLLAEGSEVTVMDSLVSGNMDNIRELLDLPGFTFLEHDVREPYDAFADEIYNLACPASPPHYQKDPVATSMTCVLGAVNALELAERRHARVLQTSTSEVYGEPLISPQKETYRGNVNPIGIRSCYDEGKRMAESLFFDYKRQYGTDIRVARIFNTYGPYMRPDDGRVISNFMMQALRGEDLTIYGDGGQTRSFCYVSDTVEALIRLMRTDGITGPVNIGNPDERTVREVADMVLAVTGSASGIVSLPPVPDDPTRRRPDITLAGELLGWKPEVPITEGLKMTAAYFRSLV